MTKNREWVLRRRPVGEIREGDLELVESPIPSPADGQVLIRNIYLSLDPTNRIWMSDVDGYLPPVGIGEVMRGVTVGVVEQSRSPQFKPGDIVLPGLGGWRTYLVADAAAVRGLPNLPGIPLTAFLSVLGTTGLTAYYGVTEIAGLKAGETMVVSAAAGAVGSVAGQIGKRRGARVIGVAGGAQKCRWIVEELGFDGAIDYRSENVGAALDRLCPDGIDVDFENVGGEIMDAVVARMNVDSRMALCGLISSYNAGGASGPKDFGRVLMKRIMIKGFIVLDFLPRAANAFSEMVPWIAQGQLKWKDHVIDDFEEAPLAVNRLFTGAHDGKLMVRVSEDPART